MDKNIYLAQFYGKSQNYTQIPREWFTKYGVKRGLRNEDHTGVLVGLTRIADVVGYQRDEKGQKVDCDASCTIAASTFASWLKWKIIELFIRRSQLSPPLRLFAD